jgi:large subunit ribosomal protein L3
MSLGILGTKLGMTQVFDENGNAVPVTVIKAGPCYVTQVKTKATDGYESVQLGYDEVKEKALTKPELKHIAKAGVETPLRHLQEFRVDKADNWQPGQAIKPDIFSVGQIVDVVGTSIGRGFAGYQKRHNFGRGPMAHGSKNHRLPGSTGAGTTPGRVFPGKKMAGRMGGCRVTVKKLAVVQIDADRDLILIQGSIPGKPGGLVRIVPTK